MKTNLIYAIALIVLVLPCVNVSGAESLASKTKTIKVEWQQQLLTVSADNVPIAKVILAIAEKTGMKINGIECLTDTTQAHISKLPLVLALKEILKNASYLLQEPSADNNHHIALSILSDTAKTNQFSKSAESDKHLSPSIKISGDAGFVPTEYQKLYVYAAEGNIAALKAAIKTADSSSQVIATRLLTKINPSVASNLAVDAAQSENPNQRITAVQILSELDSMESTKALGVAVHDPNYSVRNSAVLGLHNQTSTKAIAYLTEALQDEEASIRALALDLLAEKGIDGVAGINQALASNDPQLKERAQELLNQIISSD